MKIRKSLGFVALGVALATTSSWAQTTPTGTVNSTTYPQGAIAPDSTPARASRSQKRATKRNRKAMNSNAGNSTNTSAQDGQYRQSSSSEGTSINNSNSTNYNSNNVTNAPTGVGSNPNTTPSSTGTTSTPAKPDNDTDQNTSAAAGQTADRNANAGLASAVAGAKTSEAPAVKAGSTARNTSIGDFVASSPNYTTLQNALQSANLWETLKGTGPYTLFAPTNNAFKKLPATMQRGLLEGSNRDALKQLLSNHVVNGTLNEAELSQKIKSGNGKARLQTLSGGTLTAQQESNGRIILTDEQGNKSSVDVTEVPQLNGMVYGISSVLMPSTAAASFR